MLVSTWRQEPADPEQDLGGAVEREEALTLGIRLLLERLTPTERAAYVLRQAFGYPYAELADMLEVSEANARQLVSRAGKRLSAERRRSTSAFEHRRLTLAFIAASRHGDVTALARVLAAPDVRLPCGPPVSDLVTRRQSDLQRSSQGR